MSTIAVIGAAGFVGMELVQHLEVSGHTVIAVARSNGDFLLKKNKCTVLHPKDVSRRTDIDVVINLAYPNSGSVHHFPQRNKEILRMIELLAGDHGVVIHTSTIAVFGFQLEYPILPAPVPNRRDYLYVESKIELENLLLKKFTSSRLSIVRLGNIWGRKSAAWTSPLIDKLNFGVPVGVSGMDGYSNITDVANVVSYLRFLAEKKTPSERIFHHLAELGETRWSYWIRHLSELLKVEPVYLSEAPHYPDRIGSEIIGVFRTVSPRAVYKRMLDGRFTGSVLHSLIGMLPEEYFAKKKQQNIEQLNRRNLFPAGDTVFLWVMTGNRLFTSVIDPEWKAPVDTEHSFVKVVDWMKEIGYLERTNAV